MPRLLTIALALLAARPAFAADKDAPVADAFVEVAVRRVVPTEQGHAVLLAPKSGGRLVLPVFVGPCEANAIQMRLDGQTAPRPLTHELLDNVIRTLGARIVKVEIDDLRSNTFLGRIYLSQGGKTIQIDARPSDSIALALGAGVPIRVARKVLDQAGIDPDKPREAPEPPAPNTPPPDHAL
jgi:bifunctional DNase/RNase